MSDGAPSAIDDTPGAIFLTWRAIDGIPNVIYGAQSPADGARNAISLTLNAIDGIRSVIDGLPSAIDRAPSLARGARSPIFRPSSLIDRARRVIRLTFRAVRRSGLAKRPASRSCERCESRQGIGNASSRLTSLPQLQVGASRLVVARMERVARWDRGATPTPTPTVGNSCVSSRQVSVCAVRAWRGAACRWPGSAAPPPAGAVAVTTAYRHKR